MLDTLTYLRHETNLWFEITTLLIPGENDSDDEIQSLSEWIKGELGVDVPLHFTAFHPDFRMMQTASTPSETLIRARNIALDVGLNYVYVGNVHDTVGGSTYCPNCSSLIIERDWHELGAYHLIDHACATCGTQIPGVLPNKKGTWGRRRLPLQLTDFPD